MELGQIRLYRPSRLLTYMATLIHLTLQNQVFKLEAGLSWREQEDRRIYVFPTVRDWLTNTLPTEASSWNIELSPIEQLDDFLIEFCAGRELMFERQFNPIRHIDNGVWELKMADVRLFGWFHVKDCFICTFGNLAEKVKLHNLYSGYRDQSVLLRNQLALDDPKFVPGENPNDVISAFRYPPS